MKRKTQKEQELADNATLLRAWRKWHRERLDEVLAGPHAVIATQVVEFLKTMSPGSAGALLELMRGQAWAAVDADTKFELLHTINDAITRLRERSGLAPIDDALPDQRESAFLLIKETLFPQYAESSPECSGKTKHGDNYERYGNKPSDQNR
jgi:hypothetical protein